MNLSFPGGLESKESAYNAGNLGSIAVWENPLEKGMNIHGRTGKGQFSFQFQRRAIAKNV